MPPLPTANAVLKVGAKVNVLASSSLGKSLRLARTNLRDTTSPDAKIVPVVPSCPRTIVKVVPDTAVTLTISIVV